MGKRSNFERIERDYYRTFDPRAGQALLRHLEIENDKTIKYMEPFCGRGDLIKQFEGIDGIECSFASDIMPENEYNVSSMSLIQKDYKELSDEDFKDIDCIITNPPWARVMLHDIIETFASKKPTWLLFDCNWMFTAQAEPYLEKYCKKIVTIGRLKWIEGTNVSGKDDSCWYLFDINKRPDDEIQFYGRKK